MQWLSRVNGRVTVRMTCVNPIPNTLYTYSGNLFRAVSYQLALGSAVYQCYKPIIILVTYSFFRILKFDKGVQCFGELAQ